MGSIQVRRQENFAAVLGASVSFILLGTLTYSLGEGWNVVDGLCFAVTTLTTANVSDPSLVLTHEWLKLFTVFYVLIGIGILVEFVRELGVGFVTEREARHARRHKEAPPETQSAG